MKGNRAKGIALGILIVAALIGCFFLYRSIQQENEESAGVSGGSVSASSVQANQGEGGQIHLSDDGITVDGDGVSGDGKKVTITKGGEFTVDGSSSEGQIYIQAGDADVITLSMNGVTLTNTSDHPIHVENAGELILTSTGDEENVITAGTGTRIIENKTVKDTTQVAAIYGKDDITIEKGTYVVSASGDGIHGNDDCRIKGGHIRITCGDDGIHANESLKIKGGKVEILQSNEGLEANQIEISDGEHTVTAKDDGINANGGTSEFDQGFGRGGFGNRDNTATATPTADTSGESADDTTNEEKTANLTISGGKLYVDAQGDGLDSNGNLTISGGETIVDGPSNDGNGPLDSGSESGGVCKIEGGTILAIGSSGMAEGFDDSESTQYSFLHSLDSHFTEGTKIQILDSDGKELFSHTAARSGNSVVFSSKDLKKGKTYTLQVGDTKTEITLDSITTSNSTYQGMGGGFGGGGGRRKGGFGN